MQPDTPHLDESTSANPTLSPGPVQDQESLLRIIIEPDHIREGRIQPSAVQLRDLTQRGLSVYRRAYANKQAVGTDIEALLTRTTAAGRRRLEGLANFSTEAVRALTVQEQQVFVVIDTALPENRGPRLNLPGNPTGEPQRGQRTEGAPSRTDGKPVNPGPGISTRVRRSRNPGRTRNHAANQLSPDQGPRRQVPTTASSTAPSPR